jgi:Mg-chelatase subunit ChlD
MRVFSISLALSMLFAAASAQTADAPTVPVHAGPVYTRGEEAGAYPKYPDLQIQVEVPPTTSAEQVKPEAFRVRVDNGATVNAYREQALATTGYGIAASIALDVSGSMKGAPLNAVRSGLSKFVGDASPQDKIAIETIADESRWDANWDDSRDKVKTSLDTLATRGTLTRLWDGLLEAIHNFPATPLSQRLIVISDGHDEGSKHTEEEVIAAALDRGIPVDAIGVTRSDPVYLQGLQRLATQTGGQFRQAKDTAELEQLVSSGIQRLKSTPVVSFHLDDVPGDGGTHRFEVTWKHDGTESRAEVKATIPVIKSRARWYWGGGIAAAVVLLIVILASTPKRSKQPDAFIVPPVQPVASAPVSMPVQSPIPPRQPGPPVPVPLQPRKVTMPPEQPARPVRVKTEIIARFGTPAQGQPGAWLLCEAGFAAGKRFPLDQIEYWIGALENNHLQITDDPTVSGNHACLVFDHDMLGVFDHKSTNGTRVNGDLVSNKRRLLRPGDRIKIGRSTFAVQTAEQEGAGS